MTEIYIDGIQFDVDDKVAKIAVTYQNFSFLNLSTVKANYTNRISLPLTTNNVLNLEQIAPLSSHTRKPYENHSIRIVQGGIEIIPAGVCQITRQQSRIEIDVQSNIKDFFDAIDGLYLNDIDLSAYNGLWDDNRRDSLRATGSGLTCPLADYGNPLAAVGYIDLYTYGSAIVPIFYYSKIVDQIFTLIGYTKSGDVFSDTRYSNLGMMTRLVYNDFWLNKKRAIAINTQGDQLYQTTGLGTTFEFTKIDFQVVKLNDDGYYDLANSKYDVSYGASTPFFRATHTFTGYCRVKGSAFIVADIYKNGVSVASVSITASDQEFTISYTDDHQLNDEYECYIGLRSNPAAVEDSYFSNFVHTITPVNTTDTDIVQSSNWYWYFDQLLPRMTVTDFIKDFMKMFGLVIRTVNKEVQFKFLEDIITSDSPSTEELEKQNAKLPMDIKYNLSGFGRDENNYYWTIQSDETIIDSNYGRGTFALDNDTLESSVDQYTSPWTASDNSSVNFYDLIKIIKCETYDQSGPAPSKAASFGLRLVLISGSVSTRGFRLKAGTTRTNARLAWFIDGNQSYNLDWQEFLDEYYPTYIEMLDSFAEVTGEFLISQTQAANLDLFNSFHKNGVTYVVETIGPVVPGKFAKFKMYRILIGS